MMQDELKKAAVYFRCEADGAPSTFKLEKNPKYIGYVDDEDYYYCEEGDGYDAFMQMVGELLTNESAPKTILIEFLEDFSPSSEETQQILLFFLASKGISVMHLDPFDSNKVLTKDLDIEKVKLFSMLSQIDKLSGFSGLAPDEVEKYIKTNIKPVGAPGYHRDNPEIVLIIKSLRRKRKGEKKRKSFEAIAGILNEKGYTTMRGKPWTRQNVQRIFSSHKTKEIKVGSRILW